MSLESRTDWWRPVQRAPEAAPKRKARKTPGGELTRWSLIGFTVVLLLAPQEQFSVLAPLRLAVLSVAAAVLAYAYGQLSQKQPLLELSPEVVLVLLLIGWATLTIAFSHWPGGSVSFLFDRYLKSVVMFLLLAHALTDLRQLQSITWCLVLCAVPLTLTTLVNYVTGTTLGEDTNRIAGYSSGMTSNPNDMALTLNLILPVCLALLLGSRNSFAKLVLAGVAVLIVVAVIATFSRSGFLTLAFIGVCYAWLLRKRPQRVWIPIIIIVGMFTLPLVPASYFDRLDTIVNIQEDPTHSAQTRLDDMKVALDLALSKPIVGSGIGMSLLALNEARGAEWTDVHNVYLQLAMDLGFLGLLLFVLLWVRCLQASGRAVNAGEPDETSEQLTFLGEALCVSLLAFAFAAMFYPVAYHSYFYYFAGMGVAAGRIAGRSAGGAPP